VLRKYGPNRSSIEPRSTEVVGPVDREAGGGAGQWSAAASGPEPAASIATAGPGGRCSGPGLGWPGGADVGSGDPCGGRSDAGGGGSMEFRQGRFGLQRLGFLATIRAGGEGAVLTGGRLNRPKRRWGGGWSWRAAVGRLCRSGSGSGAWRTIFYAGGLRQPAGHKLVAWRDRIFDRQAVQRVAKHRGTCVGSM
jgi:hypothetical protein